MHVAAAAALGWHKKSGLPLQRPAHGCRLSTWCSPGVVIFCSHWSPVQVSRIVQSPRSVKQPDTPGVDVQRIVVVVEVLVDVDVLVVVLVVLEVVVVGGRMIGSGSPQWASEQVEASASSSVMRHTLEGSAQCENGSTARSQSVGISHRGPRGSTHTQPANRVNPCTVACAA
jgi:hypothetical protein